MERRRRSVLLRPKPRLPKERGSKCFQLHRQVRMRLTGIEKRLLVTARVVSICQSERMLQLAPAMSVSKNPGLEIAISGPRSVCWRNVLPLIAPRGSDSASTQARMDALMPDFHESRHAWDVGLSGAGI